MKKSRQKKILEIISARHVATQQELADELRRRGIRSTQSSISRDIVELGLIKLNGHYSAPRTAAASEGPVVDIDTAGGNLIVVKTETGQAQPVALAIDRASIDEIVGTLAGDDTILIAVKTEAAQRAAIKKIIEMFAASNKKSEGRKRETSRLRARSLFFM